MWFVDCSCMCMHLRLCASVCVCVRSHACVRAQKIKRPDAYRPKRISASRCVLCSRTFGMYYKKNLEIVRPTVSDLLCSLQDGRHLWLRKFSVCYIFAVCLNREIILTVKFSRSTVYQETTELKVHTKLALYSVVLWKLSWMFMLNSLTS